jgi:hypothetical protein
VDLEASCTIKITGAMYNLETGAVEFFAYSSDRSKGIAGDPSRNDCSGPTLEVGLPTRDHSPRVHLSRKSNDDSGRRTLQSTGAERATAAVWTAQIGGNINDWKD